MWVDDLESMRMFYTTYFGATAGDQYYNPTKQFTSYFLSFGPHVARLELMYRPDVVNGSPARGSVKGITHVAFSVGSQEVVDSLTNRLRTEGYTIFREARTTGDGHYESVVLDLNQVNERRSVSARVFEQELYVAVGDRFHRSNLVWSSPNYDRGTE